MKATNLLRHFLSTLPWLTDSRLIVYRIITVPVPVWTKPGISPLPVMRGPQTKVISPFVLFAEIETGNKPTQKSSILEQDVITPERETATPSVCPLTSNVQVPIAKGNPSRGIIDPTPLSDPVSLART